MRYFTVDAMREGTGVRDTYEGGFISLQTLGISQSLIEEIQYWIKRYSFESSRPEPDVATTSHLDSEGVSLCKKLALELPNDKFEYFSDILSEKIWIDPRGSS